MKFLSSLFVVLISCSAAAEVKVLKVSNGKAIIQFDPTDNITTESNLVLEDLSMSLPSSGTAELNCPVCPAAPQQVPPREFKRNHLISGSLKSYTQDIKMQELSVDTETKVVEIELDYYYNLKNFALGFSVNTEKQTSGPNEEFTSIVGLGGKAFFVENVAKNKAIPYFGLELITYKEEVTDSPNIETSMRGSNIELGFNFYLNDSAFIDLKYAVGAVEGDISQGTTSFDLELEQSGLALGFGIALE